MTSQNIIISTRENPGRLNIPLESVVTFSKGGCLFASIGTANHCVAISETKKIYIWGELFYFVYPDDSITLMNSPLKIKTIFRNKSLQDIHQNLEGQFLCLMVDTKRKEATLFADRYSRRDYFYAESTDHFLLSSNLEDIFNWISPESDQEMLSHMFMVYGWYAPKQRTLYKGVNRLSVGEIKQFKAASPKTEFNSFKPYSVKPFEEKDLMRYETYFRESIRARANSNGINWVSSSSGWDSSSIIGLLVDDFGADKVKMLTGMTLYSRGTGIINSFEIEKVKKIGKFFGIRPEIVAVDFKNRSIVNYWEKVLPFYKSRHIYTITSFNSSRSAERLTSLSGGGAVIFNGETSDSFHNFGFSQYATFFHTVKPFTEYADKMNCYLFGPTFFNKVLEGTHSTDKVYQIFQRMNPSMKSADRFRSKKEMIRRYLFPIIYGAPRIPFSKNDENMALTGLAQTGLFNNLFDKWFPELDSVNPETLYSWIIYIYHSMHSQGATVNGYKHAMDREGHGWRMPFNDIRLIKLLSEAPESWGRGLNLNNTKYPLKWLLKNRLKFPYSLLETGPHSYLYDVIEGFSLTKEIVYRSGVSDFFRQTIKSKPYRCLLDDRYFNIKYLDSITEAYLQKKETDGQDFNNLVSLITLCITGWYR